MLFNYLRKRISVIVVVAFSAYALYLRLLNLYGRDLWLDEYYQLNKMKGSFIDLLKSLSQGELCSYLSGDYYLIYPFFKIFSYNKWGLAIPHIISTIIGFYLLYIICRRYFKTFWGYFITFAIVCFNPTLIFHATEVRPYAVLPTLALAVLYLSLQLVEQNINMSIRKKCVIGIFFILVIWFHVYDVLMLISSIAFALLTQLPNKSFSIILRDIAKFLLAVFIIAMPFWCLSVFFTNRSLNFNRDPWQYIRNPSLNFIGFLKSIFGNLVGYKKFYFLLLGVLTPFFLSYKMRFRQIAFLITTVFFPIGSFILIDILKRYWFIQRQFIWVIPFFAFFLGWSWDSLIISILSRSRFRKDKIRKPFIGRMCRWEQNRYS